MLRNIKIYGCAAVIAASAALTIPAFADTIDAAEISSDMEGGAEMHKRGATIIVTSVTDSAITGETAGMGGAEQGAPPENRDTSDMAEKPELSSSETPPELPKTTTDTTGLPELPENADSSAALPELPDTSGSGSSVPESYDGGGRTGEGVSYTITEATEILAESEQSEPSGDSAPEIEFASASVSNIETGAMVEIEADEEGNAIRIVIKTEPEAPAEISEEA